MSEVSKSEEIDHSTQHVGPHHPAFGFMKALLTVAPGVDLTAPTCPHWEAYAEKKYGPDSELGKLLAQLVENDGARIGGKDDPSTAKS
jgi:hypothetical protein